jgi:hypothetical protein
MVCLLDAHVVQETEIQDRCLQRESESCVQEGTTREQVQWHAAKVQ